MNKKAVHIDANAKTVFFADGTSVNYDNLYSSALLPEMIKMLDNVPNDIREKASRLEHTGVALVSIGMNCKVFEKFWFYIYDNDIMSARAYMPSVKSPNNAPEKCSSIQFEIYFSSKPLPPEKQSAIDNCIYALEKLGIAKKNNILFTDYRMWKYLWSNQALLSGYLSCK